MFTFLKMPNPELPYWTNGFTTTLNIYSQVGLVTLIGLVAKNGILVVEFARQMQEKGLHKLAAIRAAATTRLRPILMTTVATVAGHFPLVLVTGAGAEARNSIGLVLVGGMAIGTLFTLFVIPSVYMLLARDLHGTLDELPAESEDDLRSAIDGPGPGGAPPAATGGQSRELPVLQRPRRMPAGVEARLASSTPQPGAI